MTRFIFNKPFQQRLLFILLVLLPLGVMLWVFIKAAWISDDAYITFRTIDNFLNGYGLRWNVAERVQTYTHPLWMWLIMLAVFFSKEYYLTVTIISLLCTMLAVVIVVRKIAFHAVAAFMAIAILISSKAFVDFSTSGLENPLSFLLMGLFAVLLFKQESTLKNFGWLCFLASLGTLNRMDTVLFYLPALAMMAYLLKQKSTAGWPQLLKMFLLGFSPFIVWEIFSIIYYGFPFPNTAYAKLSNDIPRKILMYKGMYYFFDSLKRDIVTLPIIAFSCVAAVYYLKRRGIALAAGICLYLFYILYIGGDFMSGRFFSLPLFTAVILLLWMPFKKITATLLAIIAFGIGLLIPYPTLLYKVHYEKKVWRENAVTDERAFYYQCSGLLPVFPQPLEPICAWVEDGRKIRNEQVFITGNIGFRPFYAGPGVYFIDFYGIADPFLGRLPSAPGFWSGHFNRGVPAGYLESVQHNANMLKNKEQRQLYDVLRIITRDKIFTWNRFEEIIKINFGFYNHLMVNPEVRQNK